MARHPSAAANYLEHLPAPPLTLTPLLTMEFAWAPKGPP